MRVYRNWSLRRAILPSPEIAVSKRNTGGLQHFYSISFLRLSEEPRAANTRARGLFAARVETRSGPGPTHTETRTGQRRLQTATRACKPYANPAPQPLIFPRHRPTSHTCVHSLPLSFALSPQLTRPRLATPPSLHTWGRGLARAFLTTADHIQLAIDHSPRAKGACQRHRRQNFPGLGVWIKALHCGEDSWW
jgi:hypothetical protein